MTTTRTLDLTAIAEAIRTADSRDTARAALDGLTVAQLRAVAAELHIHTAGSRQARLDTIVHFGAGRRLDSLAIARA